ncbi:hypothetical protein GJ654_05990 [Rhodoblastus acidophilus]|jgi:hypothetical protein|uniref:Uncharacterized protein n=1 Tax=Rhodoblastus acidophilus TaxID=1074 RepID=A0A6N8DMV6_RHOAC|nr:hypothetical protein [Rhodoblastus acidophilus]MCW2273371.1 hypothetical protein [Rhodoblastus acidophilus]MTV30543.1 hypothetical protein [Rhodoblastus acidophilus]
MKKFLFAFGVIALLAEPASATGVIRMSPADAAIGVQPTQTVTRAGVAHRSTRRTTRRVDRR